MRVALLGALLGAALAAAGCGSSGPVNPVAARSSAWVKAANAFCLPRDVVNHKAELAARPVFFTKAVKTGIRAEAAGLERLGVFRRIPLLAYKWRIADRSLRISGGFGADGHLIAAHRVAERYGIRCRFGALPLSEFPNS